MKRYLLLAIGVSWISGCDVLLPFFGGGGNTSKEAALKPFGSEQELTDYFSAQIGAQNALISAPSRGDEGAPVADGDSADSLDTGGGDGSGAPSAEAGDASGGSFSGTTVQESGVDEADVVKTDGTYLYIIQNDYSREGSVLKIVRAFPSDQMTVVGELELSGYARELYLHGDRIVALTETYGNFYFADAVAVDPVAGDAVVDADADPISLPPIDIVSTDDIDLVRPDDGISDDFAPSFVYARPKNIVTVIDATARNAPVQVSRTEFDGSQSSSRMIDGVLHMVISNFQNYYFDIMPLLGRPELTAEEPNPDDLLPHYRHIDAQGLETEGAVVTWENVYRPEEPDGFGVLALVSMNAENSDTFRAVGVVAEPGLIYSSTEALYVTNTNYNFFNEMRTTTDVYKFRYDADGSVPVGAGRINGRILNQYSMSESGGYLRVATTSDPTFDENGIVTQSDNNVYVLSEVAGALDVVGRLENLAPGETIQSARFLGDRGYLVTFEQIDPLFTLDLSDPANPRSVGELKVPGFSTFIVPMDENHILTVGQYIPDENSPNFFQPWGVQLTIFDVTDFAHPTLAHQAIIGADSGAYSEALYNPKAFTYFAEQGLLALPVSIYEPYIFDGGTVDVIDIDAGGSAGGSSDGSDGTVADAPPEIDDGGADVIFEPEPYVPGGFEGLYVFDVSAETGFTEMGRVSTRFEDAGYYYASFTRGVFIGNDVYAVTDNGVRSAAVDALDAGGHELLLREPVSYPDDGVITEVVEEPPAPGETEVEPGDGSAGGSDGVVEGRPVPGAVK